MLMNDTLNVSLHISLLKNMIEYVHILDSLFVLGCEHLQEFYQSCVAQLTTNCFFVLIISTFGTKHIRTMLICILCRLNKYAALTS